MASILDRYGIKEVADVTFYRLDDRGIPQNPVLYLDTLKVSTIEQTADEATANGGKGNPPLVIWDYNKDITVTLEDALFSAKSLAIMFGDGTLKPITPYTDGNETKQLIMRTEAFVCKESGYPIQAGKDTGWKDAYTDPNGKSHTKRNPKFFTDEGEALGALDSTNQTPTLELGKKYFCTYDLAVDGFAVEVSANSFPGTYYVTGDTYARSDVSGEDEFFQFIIPKAKVQSENTLTLEADGDPSTFNMSLHVMRPEDGVMMKLVKYKTEQGDNIEKSATADIYHNHYLDPAQGGTVTGDRNNNDGELRIKTMPIRANYGFSNLDELDGLELEIYDATEKTWSPVAAENITCIDTATGNKLQTLTTAGAVVYYIANDDDTHKTQNVHLLKSTGALSV